VATVLFGRFRDLFPRRRPTPQLVLDAFGKGEPEVLRKCGLSRQKATYLQDLSRHFVDGRIPTRRLGRMTDEEVIASLVEVKGIGRWTAEMFLIFTLNRPDVLPVDDLGLKEGVRDVYGLPERPGAKALAEIGERWRPYRSIATWYLWRRGTVSAMGEGAVRGRKPSRGFAIPRLGPSVQAVARVIRPPRDRPARSGGRRARTDR
jgi:DNA-3-methyladenine glycosylase II